MALRVLARWGDDLCIDNLAAAAANTSCSSAFAGTGGAENSAHFARSALQHFWGGGQIETENLWALESDQECQHELMMLDRPPQHIFGDICTAINPRVRPLLLEKAHMMNYEDLRNIFKKPGVLSPTLFCFCCQKEVAPACADCHVAGTECVAWSSQGKREGASGPRVLAWWVWVARRRQIQEPFFYHENVGQFPLSILIEELGELYFIDERNSAVCDAANHGNSYTRASRLTIAVHRREMMSCLPIQRNLDTDGFVAFERECRRQCGFTWQTYFLAEEPELQAELAWANTRPQKKSEIAASSSSGEDETIPVFPLSRRDFWDSSRKQETTWRNEYFAMCPNGVVLIGQNPQTHAQTNGGKRQLQPLIAKSDLYWSFHHCRWLLAQEGLIIHNYPLLPEMVRFDALCSFNKKREDYRLPVRRRHAMKRQCGNGMVLSQMGPGWLWIWMARASTRSSSNGKSSLIIRAKRLKVSFSQ